MSKRTVNSRSLAAVALILLGGYGLPVIAPDVRQAVAMRFSSARLAAQAAQNGEWWARARTGQQAADLWPVMTGQADITDTDTDTDTDIAAADFSRTRSAALDASWEIDLFGRASKSATAEWIMAQAEDYAFASAGADVSPSAEVAVANVQNRACRLTGQVYWQARSSQAATIGAAEGQRTFALSAIAETEGALTRLNGARQNIVSAASLIAEYGTHLAAVDADLQAGSVSPMDREYARRQVQAARLTQPAQQFALTRQWVALYKAVGCGWQRPAISTATNGA